MYLYEMRFKVKKNVAKKAEVRIMEKSTEMINQHQASNNSKTKNKNKKKLKHLASTLKS